MGFALLGTTAFLSGAACRESVVGIPEGPPKPASDRAGNARPALPADTIDIPPGGPAYPGRGFVVHEWGTNTIVVAPDGSLQRGLHHEEEDLPSFVYDRRQNERVGTSVDTKMETPVTYFYAPEARKLNVRITFPQGVFTQWYPNVASFEPAVRRGDGDPALDPSFPFRADSCRRPFVRPKDGVLDWGDVLVLGRPGSPDITGDASLEDAPLETTTWSHARAVDANPVQIVDAKTGKPQRESFLFYRGLGNVGFPLKVTSTKPGTAGAWSGRFDLQNADLVEGVGAVFALRVEKERASFVVVSRGVAKGGTLAIDAPAATDPIETYVQSLSTAVVKELEGAGLYHDESVAMVKTWARQWFRTPGVRLLYLAPQAWTDGQIPLVITPPPDETKRVMVIRVEAITPDDEEVDRAILMKYGTGNSGILEGHFLALGRFAEPRLRRAIAKSAVPPADALALLARITTADANTRAGE
jgi:hypothetical protein